MSAAIITDAVGSSDPWTVFPAAVHSVSVSIIQIREWKFWETTISQIPTSGWLGNRIRNKDHYLLSTILVFIFRWPAGTWKLEAQMVYLKGCKADMDVCVCVFSDRSVQKRKMRTQPEEEHFMRWSLALPKCFNSFIHSCVLNYLFIPELKPTELACALCNVSSAQVVHTSSRISICIVVHQEHWAAVLGQNSVSLPDKRGTYLHRFEGMRCPGSEVTSGCALPLMGAGSTLNC